MDYMRIKEIIDQLIGYFQLKEKSSTLTNKVIALLTELDELIKSNFEVVYKRKKKQM